MDLKPLLSVTQAAEILGLKPHTLDVWACKRTEGPEFVKVGRRRMYTSEAIENYIASRTVLFTNG
jgi:DNA-binding transcriptional MerR regulator